MFGCHFISGLPRAGSTLLSALLNQNPEFRAGIISPVADMYSLLLPAMGANSEFYTLFDVNKRRDILWSVFASYHGFNDTHVVFDTNRSWCARMDLISVVFPAAQVIAMVRDPWQIFDSLERLTRNNPLLQSKLYPLDAAQSVFTRADYQASPKGMIRYAWNATREAFYGPFRNRLLVVEYDDLAMHPHHVMANIYRHLNLIYASGQHHFDNVWLDGVAEFDNALGVPGLHTVRPKVELIEEPTILPPEIVHMFSWPCFWKNKRAD